MRKLKIIRPDAKGRISLGALPPGISGFRLIIDKEGRYILEPLSEIPARERWLYENAAALTKVKKGLTELANPQKKLTKLSFSKYSSDKE
ncbi:MAG: hypothetical protein A3C44_03590 [Gammaproteobacteria bacterium RIFCSPHIGHO2_02_FULL_39_13]|nr:MAG: hypothetical protein A3C44_03590 [Gammaproteobacteria bacterium RIFCSPHIGHO2_02_FULL_39_13]OGT49947.1 MAG: hypothetical protein A3E53_06200 [Gammaproteobacteria bacterium RIFCSPHIGHO2_12_FULL_39_24]